MIPLSIPNLMGNEWKYVKDCLDTGWISSAGEYVNMFENLIADYTGSKICNCMYERYCRTSNIFNVGWRY